MLWLHSTRAFLQERSVNSSSTSRKHDVGYISKHTRDRSQHTGRDNRAALNPMLCPPSVRRRHRPLPSTSLELAALLQQTEESIAQHYNLTLCEVRQLLRRAGERHSPLCVRRARTESAAKLSPRSSLHVRSDEPMGYVTRSMHACATAEQRTVCDADQQSPARRTTLLTQSMDWVGVEPSGITVSSSNIRSSSRVCREVQPNERARSQGVRSVYRLLHEMGSAQCMDDMLSNSSATLASSHGVAHGIAAPSSTSACFGTGLLTLDRALLGGLRVGLVTELTGAVGCGKTTLALSWVIHGILQSCPSGRSYSSFACAHDKVLFEKEDAKEAKSEVVAPCATRASDENYTNSNYRHVHGCPVMTQQNDCCSYTSVAGASVMWLYTSASPPDSALIACMCAAHYPHTGAAAAAAAAHVEARLWCAPVHDVDSFLRVTYDMIGDFLLATAHTRPPQRASHAEEHDASATMSTQRLPEHEMEEKEKAEGCSSGGRIAYSSCCSDTAAPVRLLVVDSLATLIRRSSSGLPGDTIERQQKIIALLLALKRVAEVHRVAVLVLTEDGDTDGETELHEPAKRGRHGAPAVRRDEEEGVGEGEGEGASSVAGWLGRSAYHAVNVRLRLRECMVWGTGSCHGVTHRLSVVKSSVCGPRSVWLRCTNMTVCDMTQACEQQPREEKEEDVRRSAMRPCSTNVRAAVSEQERHADFLLSCDHIGDCIGTLDHLVMPTMWYH